MKIVLNGCYGGFGLSYEAMALYWYARCRDLYFYKDISIYNDYSIDRTDLILVSVVETMGSKAASGSFAKLYIEEIPNGTQYKIDEYDGMEGLITKDDDGWHTAEFQHQSLQTQDRIKNMWATIKPAEEEA